MHRTSATSSVYLVHSDDRERDRLRALIARHDFRVRDFPSAGAFLSEDVNGSGGCLVVDQQVPGAYELLERLRADAVALPVIMTADGGDVPNAVRAMRAGASAFIEKPYASSVLLREIRRLVA